MAVARSRPIGILLALALGLLTGAGAPAEPPARPNVVVILADDLGWSDTSLHGTTTFLRTPNIERLAARGMLFTRAYSASPLCSPSRAALLTGLSPARTGITSPNCHQPEVVLTATTGKKAAPVQRVIQPVTATRLRTGEWTIAEALAEVGYATGHFGKWHLGREPYSALEQGFDTDIPHWHGPGPAGSYVAPWRFPSFRPSAPGEHVEDRMAREAVAWMEQHRDEPFFLNYWAFSVHAPFDAKPALVEKHRARVDPQGLQRSPTYAAMVESLDDAVGTLLEAIDRLGLAERTIVVFTADNGGNMYSDVDGTTPTSNAPLRGGKATMYEGGTRVPCVVVWPGLTQPGSRSDQIVQGEDFFPTLQAGLGLATPAGQRCDGISILPALRGGTLDREATFQFFPHAPPVPDWLPPSVSVHHASGWKLIRLFHEGENGGHGYRLYDLGADPGEKRDLAAERPEKVAELDRVITRFLADTGAVVPVPNPAYDPSRGGALPIGQPRPKAERRGASE